MLKRSPALSSRRAPPRRIRSAASGSPAMISTSASVIRSAAAVCGSPSVLEDRVALRHECPGLVEAALHRVQASQRAERRAAREPRREDRRGPPGMRSTRSIGRAATAADDHAEPADRDASIERDARGARVLRCQRGCSRRRTAASPSPSLRSVGRGTRRGGRTRAHLVVAGRLEHRRSPGAGPRSRRPDRRAAAPERDVGAGDHEPRVRCARRRDRPRPSASASTRAASSCSSIQLERVGEVRRECRRARVRRAGAARAARRRRPRRSGCRARRNARRPAAPRRRAASAARPGSSGAPGSTSSDRPVGGLEVVADELVGVHARCLRRARSTMRAISLVQRRPAALRDARVGLVADERVPEGPQLLAEPSGAVRLDEVAPRERHERGRTSSSTSASTSSTGKRWPRMAAACATSRSRFAEPVEPRGEERVDRVGHRPRRRPRAPTRAAARGRAGCRPPTSRIALRTSRRRAASSAASSSSSVAASSRGSGVEQERRGVQPAAGPLRPGVEEVGPREREHEDRAARELGDVLDQVEERRRGPVQVLQHEDDRPRRARASPSRRRVAQAVSSTGAAAAPRPAAAAIVAATQLAVAARPASTPRRPAGRCDPPASARERVAKRGVRRGRRRGRRAADEARRGSAQAVDRPRGRAASCRRRASRRPSRAGRGRRGPRAGRPHRSPRARPHGRRAASRVAGRPARRRRARARRRGRRLALAPRRRGGRAASVRSPTSTLAAGGGQQPVGLLERRARDERAALGGVARDDVAGRDTGTRDEPGVAQLARGANGAQRVVLVRRRERRRSRGRACRPCARLAAVGTSGARLPRAAPAELLAARLGIRPESAASSASRIVTVLRASSTRRRVPRRHAGRAPRATRPGAGSRAAAPGARARLGAELLDERGSGGARRPRARPPAGRSGRARGAAARGDARETGVRRRAPRAPARSRVAARARVRRRCAARAPRGGARRDGAPRRRPARRRGRRAARPARARAPRRAARRPRSAPPYAPRRRATEAVEVELARLDAQQVAGRARDETVAELAREGGARGSAASRWPRGAARRPRRGRPAARSRRRGSLEQERAATARRFAPPSGRRARRRGSPAGRGSGTPRRHENTVTRGARKGGCGGGTGLERVTSCV